MPLLLGYAHLMIIQYFDTPSDIARQASLWTKQKIEEYSAQSIFLPAGKTPIPLYNIWESDHPSWLTPLALYQVDDVISGKKKGLFSSFFREHLPSYFNQVVMPTEAGGAIAELTILGLGKNGHIAFHEPHLPEDFSYGEVSLAQVTKESLGLESSDRAISYGAAAFLKSKAILLIISGSGKREAFANLLKNHQSSPVNLLTPHQDLTVMALTEFAESAPTTKP